MKKRFIYLTLLTVICFLTWLFWINTGSTADKIGVKKESILIELQENELNIVFYRRPFEGSNDGLGAAVFNSKGKLLTQGAHSMPGTELTYWDLFVTDRHQKIVYGYFDNPNIQRIEIRMKNNEPFKEATILKTDFSYIYYSMGPLDGAVKVKAYDQKGNEILEMPQSTGQQIHGQKK